MRLLFFGFLRGGGGRRRWVLCGEFSRGFSFWRLGRCLVRMDGWWRWGEGRVGRILKFKFYFVDMGKFEIFWGDFCWVWFEG